MIIGLAASYTPDFDHKSYMDKMKVIDLSVLFDTYSVFIEASSSKTVEERELFWQKLTTNSEHLSFSVIQSGLAGFFAPYVSSELQEKFTNRFLDKDIKLLNDRTYIIQEAFMKYCLPSNDNYSEAIDKLDTVLKSDWIKLSLKRLVSRARDQVAFSKIDFRKILQAKKHLVNTFRNYKCLNKIKYPYFINYSYKGL